MTNNFGSIKLIVNEIFYCIQTKKETKSSLKLKEKTKRSKESLKIRIISYDNNNNNKYL